MTDIPIPPKTTSPGEAGDNPSPRPPAPPFARKSEKPLSQVISIRVTEDEFTEFNANLERAIKNKACKDKREYLMGISRFARKSHFSKF